MARITFFIGNGFDLNVGLETRYKDFYKYYTKEYPNDRLAKEIDEDYEYWADLEEGLGKYTGNVTPDEYVDFWKSEDNLEQTLAEYLELQMERVKIEKEEKKEEIANNIKYSLEQFHMELPKEQQRKITDIIMGIKENVIYSFISFNYTNVLDQCLKLTKEHFPRGVGSHLAPNVTTYNHMIGEILHIHGTTTEEMILGVNDADQIANKDFVNNPLYRQLLIKEETNARFGQNKINEMKQIIEDSVIICIFGMSVGKTDKIWWKYLCTWLAVSKSRRLIIFMKRNEKNIKRITKRVMFLSQNKILERMKINSGVKDEIWHTIEPQIYIKFDAQIFDFRVVEEI